MRRENYLYAGVDTHKESHTACVVTCWNELLLTVTIPNKPGEFHKLAKRVSKKANELGISPVYGLENVSGHGRALAVWLIENGYQVKDVNPALSYNQRKSAPTMEKNDEYDAYAVATVLINQLHKLPDAKPDDAHWTLSQLVTRRSTLVREGVRLKNGLHGQLSIAYPSYKQFFSDIDGKIATYFWKTYPSPVHLRYKTADELDGEFKVVAPRGTRGGRGSRILECVQIDGDTHREYQESRDFITQSFARGLERHTQELGLIEAQIEIMLKEFDYKLTTLPGVRTVTAGKIIAEIGDISRFKNAGKLARYAGIAPVTFSSAGTQAPENYSVVGD